MHPKECAKQQSGEGLPALYFLRQQHAKSEPLNSRCVDSKKTNCRTTYEVILARGVNVPEFTSSWHRCCKTWRWHIVHTTFQGLE